MINTEDSKQNDINKNFIKDIIANNIVIRSKLKEIIRESGLSISKDFAEKLDEKVYKIILDAINRAKANNRKTVMSRDL